MKNSHLFSLLFLVLINSQNASANNLIAGTYQGTIWSNSNRPGTTILNVNSAGKISGTYLFDDNGTNEKGTLSECSLDNNILFCKWTDIYGSGDWRVQFSMNFKKFAGEWFDDVGGFREFGEGGGHLWDGSK